MIIRLIPVVIKKEIRYTSNKDKLGVAGYEKRTIFAVRLKNEYYH
jgi:hypothetical protein